jgi:hypothetical protein
MPVKSNPTNPKKKSASPKKGPKPMYTSDPKDPRIQRYNDSMTMHTTHKGLIEQLKKEKGLARVLAARISADQKSDDARKRLKNPKPEKIAKKVVREKDPRFNVTHTTWIEEYKKPVQPVVYKKPVAKKVTKVAAPKAIVKAKGVSKPVEKVKPVSKPVDKVTMKPTTQEEAKKLKDRFKNQTGREFKSLVSSDKNLVKNVGRKFNKQFKK